MTNITISNRRLNLVVLSIVCLGGFNAACSFDRAKSKGNQQSAPTDTPPPPAQTGSGDAKSGGAVSLTMPNLTPGSTATTITVSLTMSDAPNGGGAPMSVSFPISSAPSMSIPNIPAGNYTITVSALDAAGQTLQEGTTQLTITDGATTVANATLHASSKGNLTVVITPDPAPSPGNECGPAPGMPNALCSDGKTLSGPGPCVKQPDGTFAWTFTSCPKLTPSPDNQCGPAPGMPNYLCSDGKTIGGPGPCVKKSDGSFGWSFTTCPATASQGMPCGGNTNNPAQCASGLTCKPAPGATVPFGDVGGTCQ